MEDKNIESCNCCIGDEAIYWKDNENNAFIDSKDEMTVMVKDKLIRFKLWKKV